jgi:hypothetical protein
VGLKKEQFFEWKLIKGPLLRPDGLKNSTLTTEYSIRVDDFGGSAYSR